MVGVFYQLEKEIYVNNFFVYIFIAAVAVQKSPCLPGMNG